MNTTSKALSVAFAATLAGAVSLGTAGMAVAAPASAPLSLPAMTQAEDVVITITDFSFDVSGPVSPGATVTVTNNDSEAHTVSSTALESGSIAGGTSLTFSAPSEPGEYPFICDFHGNMMGTLVVEAAAAPAPAETPAPTPDPTPTPTSQMGEMPKGGADTGAQESPSEGALGGIVLGGGLVLALAAGSTYVVRRATSSS
ncbi:cupredoxin domain-containing protein [Arthrobacter sp. HLT1-21]